MKTILKCLIAEAALCCMATSAVDLRITLSGSGRISRTTKTFLCDRGGAQLGLPRIPFSIEYINAGSNSLAVIPINGQSVIFTGVISGSGARYAAGRYIWWDAGARGVHLSQDPAGGSTACRNVS